MAEYPYTESGSFRVRPHRPVRAIILGVVLALAAVLGGWWVYDLGREHGGAEYRMSRATEARLRIQIEDLRNRVGKLADEQTLLERSREIDKSTFERLERQLERREQQIGHLEEELAFYRSLVSSSGDTAGMTVERLSLFPDGNRQYQYEVVLTRLDHDDTEASGHVDLSIDGTRGEESVRLEMADVLVGDRSVTDFRFKYFQALSGRIRLPDGVEPETVQVHVLPDDDEIEAVEDSFAWDSLVSGGS